MVRWSPWAWVLLFVAATVGGCSVFGGGNSSSDGGCTMGAETCACYPNKTCNGNLMCESEICVNLNSGSSGSGSGSSSGSGGGSGSSSGSSGSGSGGSSGGGSGSSSGSSGGGPTILMLSTNASVLTPSDTLVVTAVVTDPQGIAQVVGGSLNDPGGGTYGAFAVSTTSGAYSLSLSWTAIETVKDISTPSGGGMRTFAATFYDQSGRSTTKTFSIQLQCTTVTDGICAGTCVDLQTSDAMCGTCSNDCTKKFSGNSTCSMGACRATIFTTTREACSSLCAAQGATCAGNGIVYYSGGGTGQTIDCSTVPPAMNATGGVFASMDCVCTK